MKPLDLMRWLVRLVTPPLVPCPGCGGSGGGVEGPDENGYYDLVQECGRCEGEREVPGTVLDPFAGSGSTGIAAHLEGVSCVLVEREPEYAAVARARLAWWEGVPPGTPTDAALGTAGRERRDRETGQTALEV